MATRILICADRAVDGKALQETCSPELDVAVVAPETGHQSAAQLVGEMEPDILIVDTGLPDFNAKAAFQEILQQKPNIRIIALARAANYHDTTELIAAGAQAYLPRRPSIGELQDAVETVINNRIYISRRLTDTGGPGRDKSNSASLPNSSITP